MKTLRQIAIADHLWDALGRMADEMGADRDVLVNQAIHAFTRANGFGSSTGAATPAPTLPDRDPGRRALAAQVLETAAALEAAIEEQTPAEPDRGAAGAGAEAPVLYLVREDGALEKVEKERFLIGRGKHCDLVLESAKVSREHAAIVREGAAYFIEDLRSSNGTWHERARVQRRRIEDGDEYFVCSERLRCVLR